jgi:NTP pyrophosphatase (non-canonical NTP hydrolase)
MRSKNKQRGKIYQFPLPLEPEEPQPDEKLVYSPRHASPAPQLTDIVISGTFRRDPDGLRLTYEQLKDLGFNVLSPSNTRIETEENGFVYMEGESRYSPQEIELRHLDAIQRATFVWLHAPDGYVGVSGSLEVGFARAVGVPVYCQHDVRDPVLRQFVQKLASPERLVEIATSRPTTPPRPAIAAFQNYYKRAALLRGYDKEDARDTLVLMLEEFGELARAIRKRSQLARHSSFGDVDEGLELADVFLYVVHLANVLKLDLGAVVQQKELVNLRRLEQAIVK